MPFGHVAPLRPQHSHEQVFAFHFLYLAHGFCPPGQPQLHDVGLNVCGAPHGVTTMHSHFLVFGFQSCAMPQVLSWAFKLPNFVEN